jgi:replication factor C subunit 3/5
MSTLPWVEKYRPKTLDEIASQNNVINVLKKFIQKRSLPHLLLYGPPGTGKTSTIIACARELYGDDYPFMVMELNASDDRGIEVVRNRIIQFVNAKGSLSTKDPSKRENIFKLVILDETDAMTPDAQAILRKVVESYTVNARFCLICNYIQNINSALQSRCTCFRFSPLDTPNIVSKVKEITQKENINVTPDGLNAIITKSNGDMRKVVNMLQTTSMAHKVVNEHNVNKCIGYPQKNQIKIIVDTLATKSFNKSYTKIIKLKEKYGLSLTDILREIHNILVTYIRTNDCGTFKITKLKNNHIKFILSKLRDIEFNQSVNTSENIQLSALVSIFNLDKYAK